MNYEAILSIIGMGAIMFLMHRRGGGCCGGHGNHGNPGKDSGAGSQTDSARPSCCGHGAEHAPESKTPRADHRNEP